LCVTIMIDHPGVCAIFWQDGWFFVGFE